MTLTVAEANAVNTVIEHLAGAFPDNAHVVDRPLPDCDEAIGALGTLAFGAFRRLSAGYSRATALEALEARWPGALREIWMLELHGVDGEPFATEQAARRHAVDHGGWDPDDDLVWRAGLPDEDGRIAKTLYANGHRTLCTIWPLPIRGLGAEAAASGTVDAPDESVARCKVCDCTEEDPCDGGCAWVTGGSLGIELCTACEFPIARDAIASGRYPLEKTVGDILFEARGGLIPQPMLTEQEIESLQPLMQAVEAANGDPDKLDEIAREHGVVTARLAAVPAGATPGGYARAFAEDLLRSIRAGAYTSVFGLEWRVRGPGFTGPAAKEAEIREYVTAQSKLYPDEADPDVVQCRLVGPWTDDPAAAAPAAAADAKPAPDGEQPPSIYQLARQWTRGPVESGLAPHVIQLYDEPGLLEPDKVSQHVQIAHPAECGALAPGARCWFDEVDRSGRGLWVLENGMYRVRLVSSITDVDATGPNVVEELEIDRYHVELGVWSPYDDLQLEQPESAPASSSATDDEAVSDANQPLGERDTP